MARAHHYRRRLTEHTELDVTTFLNLMVVLVPFLLITAVFSRITIVELDLPTSSGAASTAQPDFRVEVIVREAGMEVANGSAVIAGIPKVDGEYDMATLASYMLALKKDHPDTDRASVLLEPEIPYDYLIQVMDVVRGVPIDETTSALMADASDTLVSPDGVAPSQLALFPEISIGEAP